MSTSTAPKMDPNEDAEIEKIMNEIDQLQQEMGKSNPPKTEPVKLMAVPSMNEPSVLQELHEQASSSSFLEETLSALTLSDAKPETRDETPIGSDNLFKKSEAKPSRSASLSNADANAGAKAAPSSVPSVILNMKGNMSVALSYECEGQQVSISCVEGMLHIDLVDGTELRIPLRKPE